MSEMQPGTGEPMELKGCFGMIFMGLGFIVMLVSGICTLAFAVGLPSDIPVLLIVGGIPFLLGVGSYKFGTWLRRK